MAGGRFEAAFANGHLAIAFDYEPPAESRKRIWTSEHER
jgi:hypothetical protein